MKLLHVSYPFSKKPALLVMDKQCLLERVLRKDVTQIRWKNIRQLSIHKGGQIDRYFSVLFRLFSFNAKNVIMNQYSR